MQTIEALVRHGNMQAAASELGLKHSSISRRVDALERELGVSLFVRGSRLRPTAIALELAQRVSQMRPIAGGVEELLAQTRREREGQLVVTTSDVLAPLLFRALEKTKVPHVEVHVSDAVETLAPGSVDFALRPGHEPQAGLKGRQLGRLRLGIFRFSGDGWIQPSASLRAKKSMRWWKEVPSDGASRVSCDSLLAMRDACAAGLGRAVLPVFIGHASKLRLERELESTTPVWLLTAPVRSDESRQQRDALATALRELDDVWVKSR